jgi:hypothetical protein
MVFLQCIASKVFFIHIVEGLHVISRRKGAFFSIDKQIIFYFILFFV